MSGAFERRRYSVDVAFVVALFLAVQAFISGAALGARAASPDPLAILCSTAAVDRSDASAPAGGVAHLVDCCTLGCPMLGGLTPQPVAAPAPSSRVVIALSKRQPEIWRLPARSELAPLVARAPPPA
ncbi:hypothetical protein SAMN02745157_4139 [Kaistia soli DSM 19436]|uniref:DUF2946 domain-containing protein n=1 Tax=Kaistia soli DSM 19436 TaxID=1122133 RepID=A0A1M5J8X1_9HYPH|nr:DUF2946 family protein [Kaistia soli]SHG37024.1 hypothetical protein SAMN02745157_4139 [Kaistia soli DSM 19436]